MQAMDGTFAGVTHAPLVREEVCRLQARHGTLLLNPLFWQYFNLAK
jgi:hypothetical protein